MVICESISSISIQRIFEHYYWYSFLRYFPKHTIDYLLAFLFVGFIIAVSINGFKKGRIYVIRIILLELLFVIYGSTVLFRNVSEGHNFIPFWSYYAIMDGQNGLLGENLMNVIIFVPIGLFLGMGFPKCSWWILIGLGCFASISIEILQYIYKRGFSEIDDVIHNTLGCLIGYGLYLMVSICVRKFKSIKCSE